MAKRRKSHKLTEFDDTFENFCMSLEREDEVSGIRSRKKLAVLDVWWLIGGVEGDGLHSFWCDGYDHSRVIESCRIVGATELAEALKESSWARDVILRGTDGKGHFHFTDDESDRLDVLEDRVYDEFQRTADLTFQFARKHFKELK